MTTNDKSEILIGIQKRIDFFRSKWDEFCHWTEDCAKTLRKCLTEQQGEHIQLEQQYFCGVQLDPKVIHQINDKRDKLQAELKAQGWTLWTSEDLKRLSFQSDSAGYPFYAPPDIAYPALWLLNHHRTNNRKPNDQENFVLDCVLLSIAYDFDDERLESRESRIFRHDIGEGKYFDRREFCKDVAANLKNRDGNKRIQRAWQRVIPRLPEPTAVSGKEKDGQGTWYWKLYEKTKAVFSRIPHWIYILTLFLAALLTCLYYLGGLQPIKLFIYRLFTHK